jgi:hypothetical protein
VTGQGIQQINNLAAALDLQIKLSWTAPGAEGTTCTGYAVMYSTEGVIDTDAKFINATTYYQSWVPAAPGSSEVKILTGLEPGVTYWFSIKGTNGSLWSMISSTVSSCALAGQGYVAATLPGVSDTVLAWSDYDNDCDLDFVITGQRSDLGSYVASLYRNDSGTFADINLGITGVMSSNPSWGDYDNDGDLDLAICGKLSGASSYISRIYRNTNGIFADIGAGLTGVNKSVAWGDYDNDGDLDLAVVGYRGSSSWISRIYINTNRSFSGSNFITAGLTGVEGILRWGDYDNDGDLDIALSGYVGSTNFARIYRNGDGAFTVFMDEAGRRGELAWGDYDNDGDLDLALSGYNADASAYFSRIYRNDGGAFNGSIAGLPDQMYCRLSWGDYDNDGDLDLALSGSTWEGNAYSGIYRNNEGTFIDIVAGLPKTDDCVDFGDYNYDGKLDLLVSGDTADGSVTEVVSFYGVPANTAPQPPTSDFNAIYDVATSSICIKWGYGSDTETTVQKGLYYDVRVATYTITENLKTWIVSPSTGLGASPFLGNYPHGYSLAASTPGLNVGPGVQYTTYYWQVRTIDTGFRKSAWSTTQSFYLNTNPGKVTGLTASIPEDAQVQLTWTAPGDDAYDGNVTGGMWRIAYSSSAAATADTAAFAVDISTNYVQGTLYTYKLTGLLPYTSYYFWVKARDAQTSGWGVWSDSVSITVNYCYAVVTNIQGVYTGQVAWADYDNDGDLDLGVSGSVNSSLNITRVYRNDNNVFVNATGASLTGLGFSALAWGDYDNDGDLDLANSGILPGNMIYVTRIYRNDKGTFNDAKAGLPNIGSGSMAWGDYDNDGDLDLAMTGRAASVISRIYKNSNGSFDNVTNDTLAGAWVGAIAWADYDNDGDLDLALTGAGGSVDVTRVYRNDRGIFNDVNAGLTPLGYSSLAWGDYDNDGNIDLVLTGFSEVEDNDFARLYRNTNGSFSNVANEIQGVDACTAAFGDIDNDGDLDLWVAGYVTAGSRNIARLYLCNGGTFVRAAGAGGTGANYPSSAWGDYDSDGVLDLAYSGDTGSQKITRIYRFATAAQPNTVPSQLSSGLSESYNSSTGNVELRWDYGNDTETTQQKGLYYEVRVATMTTGGNVSKWMISPSTGAGASPFLGNYPHGYCVASTTQPGVNFACNLTNTTYYWQVRSIDTGLKKSAWSTERQLYVAGQGIRQIDDLMAYTDLQIELSWTAPDANGVAYTGYAVMYSTTGEIDSDDKFINGTTYYQSWVPAAPGAEEIKILTGLQPGVTCWFSIKGTDGSSWSVISSTGMNDAIAGQGYVTVSLSGVKRSGSAWGDYDNDGDLDAILAGERTSISAVVTRLYRNDAGSFAEINPGITGIVYGHPAWGDYDNDGDLDLALTGELTDWSYISRIYRNVNGTFTDIVAGLPNASGNMTWGDYDNDGDLDLALCGYSYSSAYHSRIYRNDSGVFNYYATGIADVGTYICWGDYDNDGDLDIALSGYNQGAGGYIARGYRNDNGAFTAAIMNVNDIESYYLGWGDYDNDGDLDLALSGYVSGVDGYTSRIYRNDSGTFNYASAAGLPDDTGKYLSWGDYDNDGDLDLALAGYCTGTGTSVCFSGIYRNTNGTFADIVAGLPDADSTIDWGDYNNDGKLDILLSGNAVAEIVSFYVPVANIAPTAPSAGSCSSSYNVASGSVCLRWGCGSDTETPAEGLYYDVMVASYTITDNLKNWVVSPSTGLGSSPFMGNYPHGYSLAASTPGLNFGPGAQLTTYYWQVRTIDTGFRKSAWSTMQSFYLNTNPGKVTGLTASIPEDAQVQLTWTAPGDDVYAGNVTGGMWRLVYSSATDATADTAEYIIDKSTNYVQGTKYSYKLTGLLPYTSYYFWIKARDAQTSGWSVWSDSVSVIPNYCYAVVMTLPAIDWGQVAWGDYDNDGDLDLAVSGSITSTTDITRVYRNDNNSFVNATGTSITGAMESAVAWGDFDNDGDLDLANSGYIYESDAYVNRIYRNDQGAFHTINAGITGVEGGSFAWGDYDNDGDLDLAVSGEGTEIFTRVYQNYNGSFVNATGRTIIGCSWNGTLSWGDYDNDGDLDLALCGYRTSTNYVARIYRNDQATFCDLNAGMTGVERGSLAWGDYDNDGDLDLTVGGDTGSGLITRVYRNTNGSFANATATTLPGIGNYASLAMGDSDNDGDLDLFLAGDTGSGYIARLYLNNGGTFAKAAGSGGTGVSGCSVSLGDYDNNGILDLALAGDTGSQRITRIYRFVTTSQANAAPQAPDTGISGTYNNGTGNMELRWGYGSDAETSQQKGLYYEVRVATETLTGSVSKWLVSPSTGAGVSPFFGNYPHGYCDSVSTQPGVNLTCNLTNTTYYWQVRTVDTGFKRSAWIAEQQIYAPGQGVQPIDDLLAYTDLQIELSWTAPYAEGAAVTGYSVKYSTDGAIDTDDKFINATTFYQSWTPAASGSLELKLLTGLEPGVTYWFSIKSTNGAQWSAISSNGLSDAIAGGGYIAADLAGLFYSLLGWGDYDNDGDLDLVLCGESDTINNSLTRVYRNDNGTLAAVSTGLPDAEGIGSLAWGDYDNDGDLDLAFAGWTSGTAFTRIYRNGNGTFTDISAGLPTGDYSGMAWGDYDNDGDLDLAFCGYRSGTGYISRVYRNTNGVFTNSTAELSGVDGEIVWGDYDNDGDLDLALSGYLNASTEFSRIYRNTNGTFTDITAGLPGIEESSVAWGDYDNDGDLDLALNGYSKSLTNFISRIYRNDNQAFIDASAGLLGVSDSIAWGDYDSDGDLDIVISGWSRDISEYITWVYRNDSETFRDINAGLPGLSLSALAWGDYNNDGKLDLVLSGNNASGAISEVISFYGIPQNNAPSAPSAGSYSSLRCRLWLRLPEMGLRQRYRDH